MAKGNKKEVFLPKGNEKLSFSFEHYNGTENKDFCMSSWGEKDVALTLRRLKELSQKDFSEILRQSKVYHFHSVDWAKTTQRNGFPGSTIKDVEAYQFAVLGVNNQKARVYGTYYRGTFYIVWFDYNHEITPSILRNT